MKALVVSADCVLGLSTSTPGLDASSSPSSSYTGSSTTGATGVRNLDLARVGGSGSGEVGLTGLCGAFRAEKMTMKYIGPKYVLES